jgi:hypothetical protein
MWTENPFGEADQQFVFHEKDYIMLENCENSRMGEVLHRKIMDDRILRVCQSLTVKLSNMLAYLYLTQGPAPIFQQR